jgi:parallel beta-helix repeat protein
VTRSRIGSGIHARASALLALTLATAAPAAAQVRCGDVIGPDQSVTLDRELSGCAPGAAALTVVGPATLDLNGFSVICQDAGVNTPLGIVVVGKRATVRNGSVQRCSTGVSVLGEGSHRIENVVAALGDKGVAPGGEGFVVESDGNLLTGNTAVQNSAEGFRLIEVDRNRLTDNRAFFNGASGFEVLVGRRNSLRGNVANDNSLFGFFLDGGSFTPGGGRNKLEDNSASGNQQGFFVDSEDGSRLDGNTANENREDGIFVVLTRSVRVSDNEANDNGGSGIIVASAKNTRITRNTALNNDRADDGVRNFDLLDSFADCGSSRWRSNVFVTANEPCIR